jgi:hypothetical protein
MEYDFILPLNKRQILLDWVNTVDEPKCLLVSELSNMEDGSVFLEILKSFLHKTGQFSSFHNHFKTSSKLDLRGRYDLIFEILSHFVPEEKIDTFFPIEKLVTSSHKLLDLLNMVKSLYESEEGVVSGRETKNSQQTYNIPPEKTNLYTI